MTHDIASAAARPIRGCVTGLCKAQTWTPFIPRLLPSTPCCATTPAPFSVKPQERLAMDTRVDLDIVGVLENTDKSSCVRICWDYLRHYEELFEEFRHEPIKVVEIGVAGGRSLRMWKWYFTQAQLIGVDILPGCRGHAQERVSIEIGSQDDPALLDRLCAGGAPTIVIDDGSHTTQHRVATFEYLFPRLAPGGIYVIEDFSRHVGVEAADADIEHQQNSPEYFLDVGRRCFANGNVKSVQKVPMEVAKLVDTASYFANAVAFRKKDPVRDVARALATADTYLSSRKLGAQAHENLALYILMFEGDLGRATAELEKAFAKDGPSMSRLVTKAEILLAQKNRKEAKKAVAEAAAQPPGTMRVMVQLAKLQEKTGDIDGAIRSAEAACAIEPHAGAAKRVLKNLLAKHRPG
jgi:hypothetical protein